MICSGWWQLTQCIFTSRASHRLACLSSPVCSSKRQKAVPSVFVKKTKRRPRCVRQKEGKTSTMREKWEEPRDNKWGTCLWQLSPPTFIVGKWSHASLLWHFCVLILSYCVHVFDLVSFFGLKGLRKIQPKYVVTSEKVSHYWSWGPDYGEKSLLSVWQNILTTELGECLESQECSDVG